MPITVYGNLQALLPGLSTLKFYLFLVSSQKYYVANLKLAVGKEQLAIIAIFSI